LGVVSVGFGIMIGGWASNNKFSDWCRSTASQMVSYEIAMGLSIIAFVDDDRNFEFRESLSNKRNELECFYQPFLLLFFNLCFCRNKQNSFDLAECETELVVISYRIFFDENGFYLFAEYANMFISSTILAVIFRWV
jgi:NADH-quinone oxidoreductase subunit H